MLDFLSRCAKLTTAKWPNRHWRVLRGGSWDNNGRNLRSANRNHNHPDNRNHNIGFRLSSAFGNAIEQPLKKGYPNQPFIRFCDALAIQLHKQTQGRWCASSDRERSPLCRLAYL
jgi:hypothetical protein